MKKIQEVDTNFDLTKNANNQEELVFYDIPHPSFDLYGVFLDKEHGFLRMPLNVAKTVSDGVAHLSSETTGGRVRFSTDSPVIEIKVTYNYIWPIQHMTLVASAGFILMEETENGKTYGRILPPDFKNEKGYVANTKLKGGKMRNYCLYFPMFNPVKSLSIGLAKNATVKNGKKYKDIAPILYYGSSITQGAAASRSDNSYQSMIEKWNNIDYINLGFSGNAKGEDTMVDYLTTIDCSLFVCDYDYNAPTVEDLEKTHYRLYERYRKVRPDTPILFMSKPDLWGEDEKEREHVVRTTYLRALKAGDKNVYFLAGKYFYPDFIRESCAVDGCHPNDLGFYFMAKKIYKKMIEIDKLFK